MPAAKPKKPITAADMRKRTQGAKPWSRIDDLLDLVKPNETHLDVKRLPPAIHRDESMADLEKRGFQIQDLGGVWRITWREGPEGE